MRPALYLPCALLLGTVVHAQPLKVDANRDIPAPVSATVPATHESPAAKDSSAQGGITQNPLAPQDSAGQNPGAQDTLSKQALAVQQQVVPLAEEPHHQIVLQNDFVHVYSVSVVPLDATLIHRHDLPYLAVSLGPSDIENFVVGKPEARLVLQDGQVIYSPGGFAHAVRTSAGIAFRNVTVELVKPQGTARNICKPIVAGSLGACPESAETAGKKTAPQAADDDIPYFETDEVRVDVIKVAGGRDYVEDRPKLDSLLVALTNSNLDAELGGQHTSFLHDGAILWMPAGTQRRVVDFLGTHSSFLLVSFKDSAGGAKP
jgi:hypothetical protein